MHQDLNIHHIWISCGHDFKGRYGKGRLEHATKALERVECHAGAGLVGDRYYNHKPDFKGQLTLFDKAVFDQLIAHFGIPTADPVALRRNIIVSGIDLNALIGQRFTIGEVELSGSEECAPCLWMNEALADSAHEWLKGRGGLRCRIIKNGFLHTGKTQLTLHTEAA